MLRVYRIINSPIASNCFVIYDKAINNECLIVDPGGKYNDELLKFLQEELLAPKYIILTHEHFDHCWGVNELVMLYSVPVVCSRLCAIAIMSPKKNCSIFYNSTESFVILSKTIPIEDINHQLVFCGNTLKFINTTGHTKSSICFIINGLLFSGDTLIRDLETVTKLPTGSKSDLDETFKYFKTLTSQNLWVYPGHGECFWLNIELNKRY